MITKNFYRLVVTDFFLIYMLRAWWLLYFYFISPVGGVIPIFSNIDILIFSRHFWCGCCIWSWSFSSHGRMICCFWSSSFLLLLINQLCHIRFFFVFWFRETVSLTCTNITFNIVDCSGTSFHISFWDLVWFSSIFTIIFKTL